MRRVDFTAYNQRWGTTLAERFTSYISIIRDTRPSPHPCGHIREA